MHEICCLFNKIPSKGNLKRIKELSSHCGDGVIIEAGFHCDYGSQVQIGDRTFININYTILDAHISEGEIIIGSDCLIDPNTVSYTINTKPIDLVIKFVHALKHICLTLVIFERNAFQLYLYQST